MREGIELEKLGFVSLKTFYKKDTFSLIKEELRQKKERATTARTDLKKQKNHRKKRGNEIVKESFRYIVAKPDFY